MQETALPDLEYPIAEGPATGQVIEVRPGILWARLPVPIAPFHINTFLLAEEGGWLAIESGLGDELTRAAWTALFDGPLRGSRLTRVLITHWHSDHLGSAGWLCERFKAPLLMSEGEYFNGLALQLRPKPDADVLQRQFFLSHGLDGETTEAWVKDGHHFLRMMDKLPGTFHRLVAGYTLEIGPRRFDLHSVAGHSPEEILLYEPTDNLFFCADQATPKLAPNLAVQAHIPGGNPLGLFMDSLDYIERVIPADVLVMPAHELPYHNLRTRLDKLRAYYGKRCDTVVAACQEAPRTATELIPLLWRRYPTGEWIGWVISEIVSYLRYMVSRGALVERKIDGIIRFSAAQPR